MMLSELLFLLLMSGPTGPAKPAISREQQAAYQRIALTAQRAQLKLEIAQAKLEVMESQAALNDLVALLQTICPLTLLDGRVVCAPPKGADE